MKRWYRCAYCGKKIALIEIENENHIDGIALFCNRCKKINKISTVKTLTNTNQKC